MPMTLIWHYVYYKMCSMTLMYYYSQFRFFTVCTIMWFQNVYIKPLRIKPKYDQSGFGTIIAVILADCRAI